MYIATKNNPYYPAVEYFDLVEDAKKQISEWQAELNEDGGQYDTKLTLAEIIVTIPIKTLY